MEIYISGNDEFGNVTWKMTNSEIEIENRIQSLECMAFFAVVAVLPILPVLHISIKTEKLTCFNLIS